MAIRTPDIAFRDLELKSSPDELTHEPRDRASLLRRITMVEFEDDRIVLAAVNAGMGDEMVEDLLTALFPIDRPLRGSALQIGWTIPPVVFA